MDKIIIVGAGQAGMQCAESLRAEKFEGSITIIGDEAYAPYQRPPLSKAFLKGDISEERLAFRKPDFFETKNITLLTERRVIALDPRQKTVTLSDGASLAYDKLVLATGSRVRPLPNVDASMKGLHYVRDMEDAKGLKAAIATAHNIVVIGAGFIGLEVAAVAVIQNKNVTVVERDDRVMGRVVAPVMSDFYQNYHESQGVKFLMGAGIEGISQDKQGAITGIMHQGQHIPADMLVVGIGILPNVELGETAGLDVENGIVVNEQACTSDPDIFAIGECCSHPNELYGMVRLESVQHAVDQAKVAAKAIMGQDVAYQAVPWCWSDQYGLKLQMAGLSAGYDHFVVRGERTENKFSVLYYRDNKLIAIDSVNWTADHLAAKKLLAAGVTPNPLAVLDTDQKLKSFL